MDRSNNIKENNNFISYHCLFDDSSSPVDDDNGGRKRKRSDDASASSYQQTTQNTAIMHSTDSPAVGISEQHTKLLNQLLIENRGLKIQLEERDREIAALRRQLEREKQRGGDDGCQSISDVASTGNAGMVANRGNATDNTSSGSDESTDEDNQLSSNSSMDRRLLEGGDGEQIKQAGSAAAKPPTEGATKTSNNVNVGAGGGGGAELEKVSENSETNKDDLKPGVRLAIYWPGDDKHYEGTVTKYDSDTNKYYVEYDDGDTEWEHLEEGTYHVLDDDDVPLGEEVAREVDTARDAIGLDTSSRAEQDEVESEVVEDGGRLAFCCQNCTCSNSLSALLYSCVNSAELGNINLFHRGCCHNERGDVNTFKSPMQLSREKGLIYDIKKENRQECPLELIKQKYATAKREEIRVANEEYLAAEDSKIYNCPVYATHCKNFQQRRGTQISPLRVLELFSGIGGGTLALKKLRIPLHTIVHCDHDPIANEVCQFNHQRDGIRHVYIDTFEEVYGERSEPDDDRVAKLVADYGPFDLVLAGAPCANYSGLNANRDASCANAQYLPNVGKLISKLNSIQKKRGMKHGVLFLSENVVFKDFDDISKCYGDLVPIRLDAKDYSPCKRSRFYWCNIPLGNTEKYTNVASEVSADYDDILDPGYGLVERLTYDGSAHLTVKANTFLASLTKIDDDRMLKYSTGQTKIKGQTKINLESYSVGEREKMMGLPPNYVSGPLKKIFNEITISAILKPETSAVGKTYRDFMDRRYWHLRKKLKLQHYPKYGEEPYFEIGIATPIENKKKLEFFKEEQYSKHLIGMGFNICVIEALLEGLVDLFAGDLLKTYEGCEYSFPWEPYRSYHCDRQKEKEAMTTRKSTNNEEERPMEED